MVLRIIFSFAKIFAQCVSKASLSRDGTAAIALDSGLACCSKRMERSDSLTSRMMMDSIVILRSFLIFIDLDVERRSLIILWQVIGWDRGCVPVSQKAVVRGEDLNARFVAGILNILMQL